MGSDSQDAATARHKTAEKIGVEGSQAIVNIMLPKFFDPGLSADSPIVKFVKHIMVVTSSIGIIASLKGIASRSDFTDQLAKIDVPVLILSGEMDQVIPVAKASEMAMKIPDSTLKIIPDSGHLPMIDNPEATTKAIDDFLSTIDTSIDHSIYSSPAM